MHSFTRFLTRAPAGVYRLTGGPMPTLARVCGRKYVEMFQVDLGAIRGKKQFLAAMAEALHFAPWFGMNWDALADCLTDFEWQQGSAYVLLLTNADTFANGTPREFATALKVLEEAADFWAGRGVRFLVLIGSKEPLAQLKPLRAVRAS